VVCAFLIWIPVLLYSGILADSPCSAFLSCSNIESMMALMSRHSTGYAQARNPYFSSGPCGDLLLHHCVRHGAMI